MFKKLLYVLGILPERRKTPRGPQCVQDILEEIRRDWLAGRKPEGELPTATLYRIRERREACRQ